MSRPLVTVNTLLAQVREHGAIELPEDALITPAAADWLHGARVPVQRTNGTAAGVSGPAVYVVGDARSPVVQTLRPGLERQHGGLKFLPCHGHIGGLCDALHEACSGLASCSRRRGIVVVEDGAIASCVANKYPHVRAAIVVKPSALFGLLHNLGVNLLILETGHMSLRQMQATIDGFLAGKAAVHPDVAAGLAASATQASRIEASACTCGSEAARGKPRCSGCTRAKCGTG